MFVKFIYIVAYNLSPFVLFDVRCEYTTKFIHPLMDIWVHFSTITKRAMKISVQISG